MIETDYNLLVETVRKARIERERKLEVKPASAAQIAAIKAQQEENRKKSAAKEHA